MPDTVQDVHGEFVEESDDLNLALQTTLVSWEPQRELTYDEWYTIGLTLKTIGKAMSWWLGDYLNYGERYFGEEFSQAIDDRMNSIPIETLKKYKAVSNRFEKGRRVPELSWSHHFAVCYQEAAVADRILRIAEEYELSVRDVKLIAHIEDKDTFFEFVDNQIQLRHAEVMAEAERLLLPAPAETDVPFSTVDEYDDDGEDERAWLPDDDDTDSVREFFREKGLPILYADDTTIVWEGGVRLSVQRNERDAFIAWEKTV